MKKAVKIFTALFLTVSLLFGQAVLSGGGSRFYGGMSAYARTGGDEFDVIASGTCGNSLNWTLDGEGALTVSGTGAMTN